MGVDVRILTAALVLLTAPCTISAQGVGDRCAYLNAIPKPNERPELPPIIYDGLTWSERPLVPANEDRHDVCMDLFVPETGLALGSIQYIYMEEEIVGDVPISKLNYKGDKTPYVEVPFISGTFSLLMPVIRKIPEDGGDWHLVITNRQDYEAGMRDYMFRIAIDGKIAVTVGVFVTNIDDNDPMIEMFAPCEIDERGEPGVTSCKYTVRDIDGEISTRFMHFEIESDRGDEQLFSLVREPAPNDEWRWCYMVLEVKASLDFEENPLHIFRAWAFDSKPNNATVLMTVEVKNVESRSPLWMDIFPMQRFDEKIKKSFNLRAIDRDTGINRIIHYRLVTEKGEENLFKLETKEGEPGVWLHVGPIDRDALEKEVFELTIIAYKYGGNGELYETPAHIIIIIDDVNDQSPVPLKEDGIYTIDIPEETAMTLNLEDFGFHDRDLGPHAQYKVHLESVYPKGVHEAFYVAPEVGYQRQSFILGTRDHHMLDFDNKEVNFTRIEIRAVAVDMDNNTLTGFATININLINWNDELPMFKDAVRTVRFPETVGAGFHVATILAEDRDIDDKVEHSLMGNADNFLEINKTSGEIFVKVNDSFNYHRQNELIIQIRANDTLGDGPYNTNTSQLVIELEDINNTPPVLRLPRTSPPVEENVPPGHLITKEVTAFDPDTTADLWFEIDWDKSYATKQGRETPVEEFHNCVEILTLYRDENNKGDAYGRLEVRQIREGNPPVTIDYEEFEMLYLVIRVRDRKTVLGDDYDEATFAITIIDMNDNWPIWGEGQLEQQFRVREMSLSGVVIGSLHATDIDGPLYNQVRYTIKPEDGTPPDLVAIDFITGQMTVQKNQAIDADVPRRFYLNYTVTASDKCSMKNQSECPPDKTYWNTTANIAIQIIDTNNKVPHVEVDKFKYNVTIVEDEVTGDVKFQTNVSIYEGADDGFEVLDLFVGDLDRDLPNNNVSYTINFAVNTRVRDFFEVDLVTGKVRVRYTSPDDVLDRDGDEPTHRIFFSIFDNFMSEGEPNRNQINGEVLVILRDVNDNKPELPSPDEFPPWTVSERELEGFEIPPEILAPDRDEPGTNNSRVGYGLLGLTTERDIELPDLFKIETIEKDRGINQTGLLKTLMPLQGYWGTYEIHIKAYDHGDPPLCSDEKYQIVIRPYNFHEPKFVFPLPGSAIRLSRDRAVVSGELTVLGANPTPLQRISATDEDGLHAGTVRFAVVGDDEAMQYFDVWNDGENSGMLTLKQALPNGFQQFELTIRATDSGDEPGPKSTDSTVTVVFIPPGEPEFSNNTQEVAFIEFEAGTLERHALTPAADQKNILCDEGINCYTIYYTIIDGNAAGHFALDGNVLHVVRQLDRAESATHTLRVAASNVPGVTSAAPASTLTVIVTVREANPRPHFESELYIAGVFSSENVDSEPVLTVVATHTEGLDITYAIDQESMKVDPSLESIQENAFQLNPETGALMRMLQVTAVMHGMFEFDIVATDTAGATDRCHVKVYLISSRNRVYFSFFNEEQVVLDQRNVIAHTFSNVLNMRCNIDGIAAETDEKGIPLTTRTEVTAHFIKDDLPVPAENVTELIEDTQIWRDLSNTFKEMDLALASVQGGLLPSVAGGDQALAVYILAGLAGLLAALCVALLVTFIIRNRSLNRRIAALSMTKYSSEDSNINRIGLAAPGTNKHAAEGSNPIWNETIKAPDFDAISEQSNDSDLIGIEDLPQFRNDYFPPEFDNDMISNSFENPEMPSARNPIASHENNFGFNTTPFSPEFANSQLRR